MDADEYEKIMNAIEAYIDGGADDDKGRLKRLQDVVSCLSEVVLMDRAAGANVYQDLIAAREALEDDISARGLAIARDK